MSGDHEKAPPDWLGRELRRLPPVTAPASLKARVWAAIEAAHDPVWWRRPWLAWPLGWKLASVPVFLALLAAVTNGGTFALAWVQGAAFAPSFNAAITWFSGTWDTVASLYNAAETLLRTIGIRMLAPILMLFFSMYLICLAAGTACYRLLLVPQPNRSN
jgi:hypothetical protein